MNDNMANRIAPNGSAMIIRNCEYDITCEEQEL